MIPKKKCNALLILAGKLKSIDNKFRLKNYLLNIGNSLVFDNIINSTDLDEINKIYIASDEIKLDDPNFVSFKNVEFINVGTTRGVLESVLNAIKFIDEENISILPITTVPDEIKLKLNSCYFSKAILPKENWSSIVLKNNTINFLFKDDEKTYGEYSYPFTGRITAEKKHIISTLKKINESEFGDLIYLAKNLIDEYNYNIEFESWFDVGHKATYHLTKLSTLTSRFFNDVKYNDLNSSIIKSSKDFIKIKAEYDFNINLPKRLKKYFPFIYSDIKRQKHTIEMEFIPYPNLSEIFLFNDIGPNAWIRIINSISKVFEDFYSKNYLIKDCNVSWLYSEKLKERYESIQNYLNKSSDSFLNIIFEEGIIVNDKIKLEPLNKTIKQLEIFLKRYEFKRGLYIGHGDLCFNNILIDYISGSIKLIDPKSYHEKISNIYGLVDPYYDLAKLNHSFKYLYDSVVNNLYELNIENNKLFLKIFAPKDYAFINNEFRKKILESNIDLDLLRILTSNLFLSMLPLHMEDQKRMVVFAIVGSIIYNDLDFDSLIFKI